MKYIHQACIIFLFTFLGEAAARLLPLPVPGAIWGLILLFTALCTGLVREHQVAETGHFLTAILPVLFVAPTVNLMEYTGLLLPSLPAILVIIPVCTLLTFLTSGKAAGWMLKRKEAKKHD